MDHQRDETKHQHQVRMKPHPCMTGAGLEPDAVHICFGCLACYEED